MEVKRQETFADRIKKALEVKGIKQSDLRRITKIPKSSMSQYMSGDYKPKQDRLDLIARALNVNAAWLMGYDVPMERKNVGAIANKTIAKNIKVFREKANISQLKFANLLGVDETVVINIESGKYIPDKEMLFSICDILQTTPDFLDGTITELLEDGDTDAEYRYSRQPANLTVGEQMLLDLFRRVPEDQQQLVLRMIRSALGSPKQ